jgi:hypothetical protein
LVILLQDLLVFTTCNFLPPAVNNEKVAAGDGDAPRQYHW